MKRRINLTGTVATRRSKEAISRCCVARLDSPVQLEVTKSASSGKHHHLDLVANKANVTMPPRSANATMILASSRTGLVVEAVFFGLLSVVILAGNTLVCAAFYKNRKLRTKTNYYMVSLAVADIMVGVFSVPYWVYLRLGNSATDTLAYQVYITYDILCGTASIINLVMISLERCISVTQPALHRNLSRTTIAMTIAGAWCYALIVACLSHMSGAFLVWYPPFVSTASFFLPLFIIIVAYAFIYKVAKRRARARRSRSLAREIRIAVTLAVVIGAFITSWLLFFIMLLVSTYCSHCKVRYEIVVPLTKWMHYSGSMVNPIIYTYRNRDFQTTFAKILFSCGRKHNFHKPQPQKGKTLKMDNCLSVGMYNGDYSLPSNSVIHSAHSRDSRDNHS